MHLFGMSLARVTSLVVPKFKSGQLDFNINTFSTNSKYFCAQSSTIEGDDAQSNVKSLKDRTTTIPVESSIRYLNSSAYRQSYGNHLVWEQYRRNHKGLFPPRKTRKTCIRKGVISTGNPCPICRDEYLVLDHRNLDLIQQFISPHTGSVLSYTTTGICQKRHQELLVAIERAKDCGLLTFDVPFREFDYSEYYN